MHAMRHPAKNRVGGCRVGQTAPGHNWMRGQAGPRAILPHREAKMVKRAFAAVGIACICSAVTEARVTRIEILKVERVDPSSGAPGAMPPYERLSGKFYGELDPADPKNALITDIHLAARNARGK